MGENALSESGSSIFILAIFLEQIGENSNSWKVKLMCL